MSEGINQLVSQQKIPLINLKKKSNLLKAFQVDLKACLGLVLPASLLSGKSEAGFWVMFFHGPHPNLCGPYYTVLSYGTVILYDDNLTTLVFHFQFPFPLFPIAP